MPYSNEDRRGIWKKTAGRCHACRRRVPLKKYGMVWEVDHSNPRANGGTDRWSNLLPACIPCNRSKQDGTTASKRREHGFRRRPMSHEEKAAAKRTSAAKGAAAGAVIGGLFGGPAGAAIGSALGGIIGHSGDPEDEDDV